MHNDNNKVSRDLDLVKRAQKSDRRAMAQLVENNIRWIEATAMKFHLPGDREDLVSEGVLGLLEAIPKFDTATGNSFLTYAGFWITKRMRQYIERKSIVRTTETDRKNLKREYGTVPERITNGFSLDTADVRHTIDRIEGHSNTPEEEAEISDARRIIQESIESLPKEYAWALKRYYGIGTLPRTQTEIAEEDGISKNTVSKRIAEAKEMLRCRRNLQELFAMM